MVFLVAFGCTGGDARVELAAADVVDHLAVSMALAVQEYHADIAAGDDDTERGVAAAYATRVKADVADAVKTEAHMAAFL